MRALVTWGSRRGGTEGLARMIADDLRAAGVDVEARPARDVAAPDLRGVDAVVVGGALYANRWHRDARRFVRRHHARLREVPVWMFSSGPLDDTATREAIPPVRQVRALMETTGALGHQTFGGRLAPDARGFPASAMARTNSGDWRDRGHVRRWATSIAEALPARPGTPIALEGASPVRLVEYAATAWVSAAIPAAIVLVAAGMTAALVVHAAAVVLAFAAFSRRYFRPRGALAPLPAALAMTGIAAFLDVFATSQGIGSVRLESIAVAWPLVFAATWATGTLVEMLPFPKRHPA